MKLIYALFLLTLTSLVCFPMEIARVPKIVKASYYNNKYDGRKTASGEIFKQDSLTCASNKHPLGTVIKVTNTKNGRSVDVKVNDRLSKKYSERIDLSKKAFSLIAENVKEGIIEVEIREI